MTRGWTRPIQMGFRTNVITGVGHCADQNPALAYFMSGFSFTWLARRSGWENFQTP